MTATTGKEALMELLVQKKVKYIFGLPGATEVLFMAALEQRPEINYILGLNEVVVAGMAEGYARITGNPGVLNLHTLSRLAASLPMLDNAHKGRVPLVVTAGQQDTRLLMYDPPLSGEMVKMASQVTKWSGEITSAADIPFVIHRAFKMALQPPAGPVFISLPYNILDQSFDFEPLPDMELYVQLRPDEEAICKTTELLTSAKTPMIVVGSGVARNNALLEVVNLAELIGARVYHTWMSDVNFPVNHSQYLGDLDVNSPRTREMLNTVDVLIVIGCPLFEQAFYQPKSILSADIKVIQIDDDPWEIAKNFPVTVGIQGNIKISLTELTGILRENMSEKEKEAAQNTRRQIAREKDNLVQAMLKKAEQEKNSIPVSVSRLMTEIKSAIEPDTMIVEDCWSCSSALRNTFDLAQPYSYQRTRGGSIGWGLSGAIGVKLGAPDQPVVAISGDGSAMWSIQSLWTAAHYNIPITYIIIANRSYRQVKIMRKILLGGNLDEKHIGMDLDQPAINFSQLAQAMGVAGQRVERLEDLADTLKTALGSGKPTLVEVVVETPP